MKFIVEYMFKQGTDSYTESPLVKPFTTVDQAIDFIKDTMELYPVEWMFIHLESA